MGALVIYDETGKIWHIVYGDNKVPQGIPSMFVDIPDGAILERIDVTDPLNPNPVFSYLPESDIGRMQKRITDLEGQLENVQMALVEQYEANITLQEELTNTQLALVELYENKEVL